MKLLFIKWLKRVTEARPYPYAILLSVVLTQAVLAIFCWLVWQAISMEFLLAGLMASLLMPIIQCQLSSYYAFRNLFLQNREGLLCRHLSNLQQLDSELRIAQQLFDSWQSTLITDADCNILRVNKAFTETTGYSQDDVLGKSPRILNSDHHTPDYFDQIWTSLRVHGYWQGEIWDRCKNGDVLPKWLSIHAVSDHYNVVSHYIGTYTDLREVKRSEDEIERLAFYDPLTNLPNRRLLQDRLKLALAASHRSHRHGGLLFIDLDNFKILNDTFGHELGDILLQQVAVRLAECVREDDTVARLGGDEFVVVLENLSADAWMAAKQIEAIGNKLHTALCLPYLLHDYDYRSTPSIGATLFSGHTQTLEELLKQADIAMYQAKNSGRNAFRFFDPEMQASITARLAMENDLRLAIKEQHFVLYYQPQVFLNNQIIGAEVLIRWLHPQQGLIPPVKFIPLAEETGLILDIGAWVMATACKQLKAWEADAATSHIQLAVNVSANQFRQPDFVLHVCELLNKTAINPNLLKLELTETMVLSDIDDTIKKMNALRAFGVRFSMDDFGTGYSSLSSLKKLPLDQLKIDQSFVRDILDDPDDAVIVETIIAMANHLGMEVIAEGVENEAQRQFLQLHDCQVCQGYLFSKPIPLPDFEVLLKQYQAQEKLSVEQD